MEDLLRQVVDIAKDAGALLMGYYGCQIGIEQKQNHTPVTDADYAANALIQERLRQVIDTHILSEESVDDLSRLEQSLVWVVDPLDGTKDFLNRTGEFSVMIGLVKDNSPILGVVYAPAIDELYYAASGHGAYREHGHRLTKMALPGAKKQKETVLAVSRSNKVERDRYIIQRLGMPSEPHGSTGIKVGLIMQGQCDAYFTTNENTAEYDTCAADLILREAGGKMTDIEGNALRYNQKHIFRTKGVIAGYSPLQEMLVKRIGHLYTAYENRHL